MVRTSRCGRDNPGSTPGEDNFSLPPKRNASGTLSPMHWEPHGATSERTCDASGSLSPMHRACTRLVAKSSTNTSGPRIRHWNLCSYKTPPGGFEPQPKGLRGRNSPTCTLSQNGYGTPCCGHKGRTNIPRTDGGSCSSFSNAQRSRVILSLCLSALWARGGQ